MTRISEVHGIPFNEFADRGKQIKPVSYVPYLSLTTGEMKLQLAAQRARVFAEWYGNDAPQYAEAERMLNRALQAGIHAGGALSIGAIPDDLQPIARLINRAQYQTAPASGSLFVKPQGITGGIGAEVIPAEQRKQDCLKAAKFKPVEVAKCNKAFQIEQIINKYIEPGSHHMLYKSMPKIALPLDVSVKRLSHKAGVEGMASVGRIKDTDLMSQWIENGIVASNAAGNVGPLSSVKSSFYLSPTPEKYIQEAGINSLIGAALVGLLLAAIQTATKWLTDLQKVDILAMSEAKSFGTKAYSANEEDWLSPETTGDNTMMLIALGVGAYLLMDNK